MPPLNPGMARVMVAPAPMREVQFARRKPVFLPRVVAPLPLFSGAEDRQLKADASAVVATDDGQRWAALPGWLRVPSDDPDALKVQCRRSILTVEIDARSEAAIQLLPLTTSPPKAELVYHGPDGLERRRPLQVVLDSRARALKLNLPFPDTSEGRTLYGEVVDAMSRPPRGVSVEVTGGHRYNIPKVQRPRFDVAVLHDTPGLAVAERPIVRDHRVAADRPVVRDHRVAVERPIVRNHRVVVNPDLTSQPVVVVPPRVSEPTEPPPPVEVTLEHLLRFPVFRRLDDASAYPDLPRQQQNGWGQVPGREGKKALLFRDSPRPDAFFYLPTAFKLGFYGDAQAGLPPMRADQYLDEAGGYRVKVTLVALPFIGEAEREELRTYLRDVELDRMIPYVRLAPAGGLQASFQSELGAGPASDARILPASIRFTAAEVVPDERLILQFDMAATDYALFCELLRQGLRGQVQLAAEGVRHGVDVRLELDDVVTNALSVGQEGVEEEGALPKVLVGNLLDLPVELSSVRVGLVDTGQVAGMVFEAEEQELARGQRLDPRGTVSLPVTPRGIESWDETVVLLGPARVDGGTPEEWLDRVHRDPSLQPEAFHVKLQAIIPATGADRLQLLRLRLFRDGEAAPREERELLPGSGPLGLPVRMTLAELAGEGGTGFSLEYDSLFTDGGASLPQRVALDPGTRDLPLLALIETPGATYRVEHGGTPEELDRASAAALVSRLRQEGKRWRVYSIQPKPGEPVGGVGEQPVTPTPEPEPQPSISQATVLADLLAGALETGQLQRAFVVLRAPGQSITSTLVFDLEHRETQTWRPTAGTIPPFEYKITYLYAGGKFKQVEGNEEGLMLVLDPPAPD